MARQPQPTILADQLRSAGCGNEDRNRDIRPVIIGLAFSGDFHFSREIIKGIGQAAAAHPGWMVIEVPHLQLKPTAIRRLAWRPDGIIALSDDPALRAACAATGVPLVNLAANDLNFPVDIDEAAVGRLAVEHFSERGFRHLVLACPDDHRRGPRARGFLAAAQSAGIPVAYKDSDWLDPRDPVAMAEGLADWLRRAPLPVGLFCHNDNLARAALLGCWRGGLAIPQDVGVLSVDDDPLQVELGPVALSSIRLPFVTAGRQAVERLALIRAGKIPAHTPPLAPIEVIARASTDLRRVADPVVAAACAWIAAHLDQAGVEAVARAADLHRRTLERRFQAALGRSILAEIQRVRLSLARSHLRSGTSISATATAVGLSVSAFAALFTDRTGMTPGEYRQRALTT